VKHNRKRREHEQDLGRLGHAPRAATGTQTGEKETNCNHGPNQTEENKIEADPRSGEIQTLGRATTERTEQLPELRPLAWVKIGSGTQTRAFDPGEN
jgi:hypothetical protein